MSVRAGCALLALIVVLTGCGRLRFEALSDVPVSDGRVQPPDDADSQPAIDAGAEDGSVPGDELDANVGLLDDSSIAPEAGSDTDGSTSALDAMADAMLGDAGDADLPACGPGKTGAACDQCVRYIDVNSPSSAPDGLTWQSAYKTMIPGIGAAMNAALALGSSATCQAWVREGRYSIYSSNAIDVIPLPNQVLLFGGFSGTERAPSQRDLLAHPSILDAWNAARTARTAHAISVSNGGYVDGFTITGGLADATGFPHNSGGGVVVHGGTLLLKNLSFVSNTAIAAGGALYAENANLHVEDCSFTGNQTDGSGGAIALGSGMTGLTLRNVSMRGNTAGGDGAGVFVANAVPIDFANLVLAGNTAGGRAGGMYLTNISGSVVAVSSSNNIGGATASGLLMSCVGACSVRNSIFWDPAAIAELALSGMTTLRNSIVRGGATGTGILNADPRYVSATDLHLSASSPAIDAADGCSGPELDLEGRVRVDVVGVTNSGVGPVFGDLGAYEYQVGGTAYLPFAQSCM